MPLNIVFSRGLKIGLDSNPTLVARAIRNVIRANRFARIIRN